MADKLFSTDSDRGYAAADVEGGAASTQAAVSMKELLANRGVFIGSMIFLLQQFSGVNSVVYFSSSVFAKASTVPRPVAQPDCMKAHQMTIAAPQRDSIL